MHPAPLQSVPREAGMQALLSAHCAASPRPSLLCLQSKSPSAALGGHPDASPHQKVCACSTWALGVQRNMLWIHTRNGGYLGYFSWKGTSPSPLDELGVLLLLFVLGSKGMAKPAAQKPGLSRAGVTHCHCLSPLHSFHLLLLDHLILPKIIAEGNKGSIPF